ncbi:MAG: hypothetical protein A2161_17030 [Candidatus Schekmanbacteria bacterium RBG_13_48_7]|uniref:Uncharacterized protein n=1 Tax=Candidatus Schekmanbacteria bacterium RBG_13_48_7 TaxID=1817878 RepID=A0A1F7S7H2_9BACT|nr:MAG: hypothetical protein A2161_17030 [Candidatus Schekmanbacteria bacterium RBG_13_48_7]
MRQHCVFTGKRQRRVLSQQGFELANGLPFIVSDWEVHKLLDIHTVADAMITQLMLGKLREALGHYAGKVITIDPHRIDSYSKRLKVRSRVDPKVKATKQLQTFFAFDGGYAATHLLYDLIILTNNSSGNTGIAPYGC